MNPMSKVKSFKFSAIKVVFSISRSTSISGYFLRKIVRNPGRIYYPIVKLAPTFIIPLIESEISRTSIYVVSKICRISFALL